MNHKQANPASDDSLALLLSRLAALQGHAVPVHRFSMQASTAEGLDLASLKQEQRARELWLAR